LNAYKTRKPTRAFNNETIVSTPIHRFWVVGKGWVMAQDLKVGDKLRLVDGSSRIDSIETGQVQPVFNLQIPDSHDFFVGANGALVHDASMPDTRINPFDAAPVIASVSK